MIPAVIVPSIIIVEEDLPSLRVPLFDGTLFRAIIDNPPTVDVDVTDKTVTLLKSDGSIAASGGTESLHVIEDDTNYQSGAQVDIYIILSISQSGTRDIEIIEDSTVDAGTGTTKLDLSALVIGVNNSLFTCTKVTIAASKFITIKNNSTGTITSAVAYVVT